MELENRGLSGPMEGAGIKEVKCIEGAGIQGAIEGPHGRS
jgi:hypothetical protein